MRVAVISDIHANLHALEAVLAAVDAESPDAIWCLGDLVGYGPQPNACCSVVRERARVCLAGNHDLAALGTIDIGDFSPDAATSARWTRGELTEDARTFLGALEPTGSSDGVALFHGSPRDPVWDYVLTEEAAAASFAATTSAVVLVGHSHVAMAIALDDGRLSGGLAPGGTELDLRGRRWLLNPGSVGRPRDGYPRAAFLMIGLSRQWAAFRRIP